MARGQVNDAIVQLQTAVTAEPESVDAHLALADAFTRAGRNSEALGERQKAEMLAKDHPVSDNALPTNSTALRLDLRFRILSPTQRGRR